MCLLSVIFTRGPWASRLGSVAVCFLKGCFSFTTVRTGTGH